MSVLFIRKYLKAIYVLALPVYFYISYSSVLNKHSHVNANGIVIMHSHPVNQENDEPSNEHNHSKKEICLYQSLNFDYFNVSEDLQTEAINHVVVQHITEKSVTCYRGIKVGPSSPRAPPVSIA